MLGIDDGGNIMIITCAIRNGIVVDSSIVRSISNLGSAMAGADHDHDTCGQ